MPSSAKLLTRDEFRLRVFQRDGNKCVLCGSPAQDAHHIVERRLWPDGGYYLDNGASVCGPCHLKCESTEVSCEEVRKEAGITSVLLPPHLSSDTRYDKWGNPYLGAKRTPGELFFEESVQKILSPFLHEFTWVIKYPRTFHLPWSPGATSDDKTLSSVSQFEGQEVVVTVKMDGENTSLYRDRLHARSLEWSSHESRNLIKQLWATLRYDIPEKWRICGENLTAVHSIRYNGLKSMFQVFSIWNEYNQCLSWDDTVAYAEMLGLVTAPVLYRGLWKEDEIRGLYQETHLGNVMEGYVVRVSDSFSYGDFRKYVGKFVRENHVQTDQHWSHKKVEYNGTVDDASWQSVWSRALEVLGGSDPASAWMETPNIALGGAIPLAKLDSSEGVEEILTILGRLDCGVMS